MTRNERITLVLVVVAILLSFYNRFVRHPAIERRQVNEFMSTMQAEFEAGRLKDAVEILDWNVFIESPLTLTPEQELFSKKVAEAFARDIWARSQEDSAQGKNDRGIAKFYADYAGIELEKP